MRIETGFNIGQEVYTYNVHNESIYRLKIKQIRIEVYENERFNNIVYFAERQEDHNFFGYFEEQLFLTKEEALKKLGESING